MSCDRSKAHCFLRLIKKIKGEGAAAHLVAIATRWASCDGSSRQVVIAVAVLLGHLVETDPERHHDDGPHEGDTGADHRDDQLCDAEHALPPLRAYQAQDYARYLYIIA